MDQLNEMAHNEKNSNMHLYIDEFHVQLYVRALKRYDAIKKRLVKTLEIGQIMVDEEYRRQGNCTRFLNVFEALAKATGRATYVENVENPVLVGILTKRGYSEDRHCISCYWKFYDAQ